MSAGPPFDYLPLPGRPALEWPGGAPVAVWIAVNVEHYPFGVPGLSIVPITASLVPDPMNYGWRDYGARVGVFRMMEVFDDLGLPVSAPLHTDVCEHYPEIVDEGARRNWAWIAHGRNNAAQQTGMEREAERTDLAEQTAIIERHTGWRPRGWLGPALTETFDTPDLLAELGYTHVLDWCNDDQPYRLRSGGGRLLSVPYSIEVNDIPLFLAKGVSGPDYERVLVDQFDVLCEQAERSGSGLVMAIPVHAFLVGLPFRLRYLRSALEHIAGSGRAWCTTSDAIADAFSAQTGGEDLAAAPGGV